LGGFAGTSVTPWRSTLNGNNAMLTDTQVSILCDIAQSTSFSDDRRAGVEQLLQQGYVTKHGDVYELTPKAEKELSERGVGLHEA
jgi:hypothetical protein